MDFEEKEENVIQLRLYVSIQLIHSDLNVRHMNSYTVILHLRQTFLKGKTLSKTRKKENYQKIKEAYAAYIEYLYQSDKTF